MHGDSPQWMWDLGRLLAMDCFAIADTNLKDKKRRIF